MSTRHWQRGVILLAVILGVFVVVLAQVGGGGSEVAPIVQGATLTNNTPVTVWPADPNSWLCGTTAAEPVIAPTEPLGDAWYAPADPSVYGCVQPALAPGSP